MASGTITSPTGDTVTTPPKLRYFRTLLQCTRRHFRVCFNQEYRNSKSADFIHAEFEALYDWVLNGLFEYGINLLKDPEISEEVRAPVRSEMNAICREADSNENDFRETFPTS